MLESPVGEGPHLLKLFFLSVQYLAQVPDNLKESTKQAHWFKKKEGSRVLLEFLIFFLIFVCFYTGMQGIMCKLINKDVYIGA